MARVVLQISEARALSAERPVTCAAGTPDDTRFSPGFLIASHRPDRVHHEEDERGGRR